MVNPPFPPSSPHSSLFLQGEIIACPISQDRLLTRDIKKFQYRFLSIFLPEIGERAKWLSERHWNDWNNLELGERKSLTFHNEDISVCLVYLFNSISTPSYIISGKIWFISKCLIIIRSIYIWFGLFNGKLTPYGLFNAKIWFISKCLAGVEYTNCISTEW